MLSVMMCKPLLKGSWIGGEHSPVGVGERDELLFSGFFFYIVIGNSNYFPVACVYSPANTL